MTANPVFFQSATPDTCAFGNYSIEAAQNSANGNLCATIPSIPQAVWACPAPETICWTWNHPCSGQAPNDTDETPGEGQYLCSKDGGSWCCLAGLEDCTRADGEQNVCWANTFGSPLAGVSAAVASASASAAVVAAGDVFTTMVSSTVIVPSRSSVARSSNGSAGTVSAVSSTQSAIAVHSNVSRLSGGAIAGIVIGAVAVLALIANVALVFLWCGRKRKPAATHPRISELGSVSQQRVELPQDEQVHQLEADKPVELGNQTQWPRSELGSVPSDQRINRDEIIELTKV